MTLNDKLAQLRTLLQDIEEEGGDGMTVAYDLIGGHIDNGTTAGRVVASDWRRLRTLGAVPCYFASGLVGAVMVPMDAAGTRPLVSWVEVECPLQGRKVTMNTYQMIGPHDKIMYACCENAEAFDIWESSVRTYARRERIDLDLTNLMTVPAYWPVVDFVRNADGDPLTIGVGESGRLTLRAASGGVEVGSLEADDTDAALQSCRSLGIGDQPARSIMDMYGLTIHDDEHGTVARALGAHPSAFCDRYVQGNEVVWEREIPQPLPPVTDPVEAPTFFQAVRRRMTGDDDARPGLFSMEEVRAWNERAQALSQAVQAASGDPAPGDQEDPQWTYRVLSQFDIMNPQGDVIAPPEVAEFRDAGNGRGQVRIEGMWVDAMLSSSGVVLLDPEWGPAPTS